MEKFKLLKLSARESFKHLRSLAPFECGILESEVFVSNIFWDHINSYARDNHPLWDLEERLLIIPFIKECLFKGKITQKRKKDNWIYYRIEIAIKNIPIACIISKKEEKHYLLSCFISTKNRPVFPSSGNSRSGRPGQLQNNFKGQIKKSQLEITFQSFIKDQKLSEKSLLLLVSGGVDSMTLLFTAAQVHPIINKLHVLHFNHQTRPENEAESLLVQNYCSKLNISCSIEVIPPPKSAQNVENYWREFRQKKSQEVAQEKGCERILTAHHATDLVETMLFRLVKGCGVEGLSPFDLSTKPFWKIPKSEIIEYAILNKIPWAEDSSNQKDDHARNLIRNKVLPELRKITPNLEKVFVAESEIFSQVHDYLNSSLQLPPPNSSGETPLSGVKTEIGGGWGVVPDTGGLISQKGLPLSDLLSLPKALQSHLFRSLTAKTPSFDEMADFFRWIEKSPQGGSQKELGGTIFKLEKGVLKLKTPSSIE